MPVHAERIKDLAVDPGRAQQPVARLWPGRRSRWQRRQGQLVAVHPAESAQHADQLGIVVPPNIALNPKNVAAVTVHADLPPFSKPGQLIDVTVSSIGDARACAAAAC